MTSTANLPTAAQLAALRRADPRLADVMRRLPQFPGFPDAVQRADATHYHALARAVVYQQLSLKAAATIHARVVQLAGAEFPRAEALVRLSSAQLRACGLSAAKVRSLQDLASRTLDGRLRLERAGRLADEELVEHVTQVQGIGPWTVHMFLLFRLGRLDVGASGDMGVQEGLRYLDGLAERPTPAQALRRMERWRPLRSVGCWYMWRLLDAERAAVKRT